MAGGKGGAQGGRANRQGSHRKGAPKGSGGKNRRSLEGKGPTPAAERRKGHPAQKAASRAARRAAIARPGAAGARGRPRGDGQEMVAGRNSVVEALRAEIPATRLVVRQFIDSDDRVREAITLAAERGMAIAEASAADLDRLTSGALHQGIALQIPPYEYAHPDDLLLAATDAGEAPLLVALDGVTDPRNLGAVVRSAAAFGAHGVVVPERRAAGMTAAAWKASAGAAVRLPVARATNLTRTLRGYQDAGLTVVGLAADGDTTVADLSVADDGLVLVVGSEGGGLSRLVAQTCDRLVRIPISGIESLNAGVAAGIALYEVARDRSSRR